MPLLEQRARTHGKFAAAQLASANRAREGTHGNQKMAIGRLARACLDQRRAKEGGSCSLRDEDGQP